MLPIQSVLYEMLPRQNVTIRKCTIQNVTDPSIIHHPVLKASRSPDSYNIYKKNLRNKIYKENGSLKSNDFTQYKI